VGESHGSAIGFGFNGSVQVEGRGQRVSSDGGALLLREVDDALGLTRGLVESVEDGRSGACFSQAELLRQRLYMMALGYGVQSDSDLLREDPALRLAISDRRGLGPLDRPLASQPTLSRFTHGLTHGGGLEVLERALVTSSLAGARLCERRARRRVLDIDSLPVAAHGVQGGSAYNGHYRYRCFHPQVVMDETGHLLAAKLRPGNEATSTGAVSLLGRVIEEIEAAGGRVDRVRGDAGFPSERLLGSLEKRGVGYVFRLLNNSKLGRMAEPYLVRPPGRRPKQPREWTHVMRYRASRWSRERRIVLVVQERPDDLFLHHFFLVASDDTRTGAQILNFYRQRGTMEARLGEWMHTLGPALSSSHRDGSRVAHDDDRPFRVNAATLLLNAFAYNLLHTLRCLAAKARIGAIGGALGLSRTRRLLLAVAGRLIVSARRATLLIQSSTADMWSTVLARLRSRARAAVPA
jgi:hypothetical protein